jgi:hypothetical protein
MNVLIICNSLSTQTGSDIYFRELIDAMRHSVDNLYVYPIHNNCKDFLGEAHGENVYVLSKDSLDIVKNVHKVYFSHWNMIKHYIDPFSFGAKRVINIIHSEVLAAEAPCLEMGIYKYIAIRPSIQEHLNKQGLEAEVIYNPFDVNIFNPVTCKVEDKTKDIVLFPGSLDYLRVKPIKHLLTLSEQFDFKVQHVGRVDFNISHKNFTTTNTEVVDIMPYYKQANTVAGILWGRTAIEALLSGKRYIEYTVNKKGEILGFDVRIDKLDPELYDKHSVADDLLYL